MTPDEQKTTTIGGKRVTAAAIIKAQDGRTKGDDYTSTIHGVQLVWAYRTAYDSAGYLQGGWSVCEPERAQVITLEEAQDGIYAVLTI